MIVRFILHHLLLLDVLMVLIPLLVGVCGLWLMRRRRRPGLVVALLGFGVCLTWVYGRYVGSQELEVTHVEFASEDLPESFDGYRIVHFSDAHVGTPSPRRDAFLRRAVDSINAQQADMVVFTGDLQNVRVQEVYDHQAILARVHGRDGVVAVLGNHDYAMYLDQNDPYAIAEQLGHTDAVYADLGWRLLRNSHIDIRRDSASISFAGMENDGEGRFPKLGDHNSALYGLRTDAFVVMLEHDPASWRRRILPRTHCQLTLSGHTHGGQLSLFGWSPASLFHREYHGMYHVGERAIYINRGLAGAIPFRLGCPAEVTVITLKKATHQ